MNLKKQEGNVNSLAAPAHLENYKILEEKKTYSCVPEENFWGHKTIQTKATSFPFPASRKWCRLVWQLNWQKRGQHWPRLHLARTAKLPKSIQRRKFQIIPTWSTPCSPLPRCKDLLGKTKEWWMNFSSDMVKLRCCMDMLGDSHNTPTEFNTWRALLSGATLLQSLQTRKLCPGTPWQLGDSFSEARSGYFVKCNG